MRFQMRDFHFAFDARSSESTIERKGFGSNKKADEKREENFPLTQWVRENLLAVNLQDLQHVEEF